MVTGLRMDGQSHLPPDAPWWRKDNNAFRDAVEQIHEYFAGDRRTFTFPFRLEGSDFQCQVWEALRTIPYGETCSYGEIAIRLGKPGAARAVGVANSRNPVAIVVPCHRVIGATGALVGYGGGVERKAFLLDLEAHRR
jgi:methylated-DNA-[protein]-cysteine S-methyltransferase